MPFVSRRELSRLIRDLEDAKRDKQDAERRLHELSLAVLDTKAAKEGGYPVSSRLPKEPEVIKEETQQELLERAKREDSQRWNMYLSWAAEAHKTPQDAEQWLWNDLNGLPQPFERVS